MVELQSSWPGGSFLKIQELQNLEGKVHIQKKSSLKQIISQFISDWIKQYKPEAVPRHLAAYLKLSWTGESAQLG